jgi:hypothetical protein
VTKLSLVLDSTEPANYRGSSSTRGLKEIVDIEIAMYQSAGTVIIDTITITPKTIVTTAMQLLLSVMQGRSPYTSAEHASPNHKIKRIIDICFRSSTYWLYNVVGVSKTRRELFE